MRRTWSFGKFVGLMMSGIFSKLLLLRSRYSRFRRLVKFSSSSVSPYAPMVRRFQLAEFADVRAGAEAELEGVDVAVELQFFGCGEVFHLEGNPSLMENM